MRYRAPAALVSGLLVGVAFPPVSWAWLQWFLFLPLLWALRPGRAERRRNLLLGYLCGCGAQLSLHYWLIETVQLYGKLPWVLGALVLLAFVMLEAVPYALAFGLALPMRRRLGPAWVFVFPTLWICLEFLYPQLFSHQQGSAQFRTLWTWQLVSITSTHGISYLLLLSNCVLAEVIYRRREGRGAPWISLAVTASLVAGALIWGALRVQRVEAALAQAPTLRVGLVQQNLPMRERNRLPDPVETARWFKRSGPLVGKDLDLLVWPEGALREPDNLRMRDGMKRMVTDGGFELVAGAFSTNHAVDEESGERLKLHANSTYHVDRQGEFVGRYDKMVLFPFGEFNPFDALMPGDLLNPPDPLEPGQEATLFKADGYRYEATLRRSFRRFDQADLFVNITNDGWFGDSSFPHLHGMVSAVRAVELGRPMVRSAYTGSCMVIEPHGRIAYQSEPFTDVATVQELRLGKLDTLYRRLGDWFIGLCFLAVLAGGLAAWRRDPSPVQGTGSRG